jgi:hypothetical protein
VLSEKEFTKNRPVEYVHLLLYPEDRAQPSKKINILNHRGLQQRSTVNVDKSSKKVNYNTT